LCRRRARPAAAAERRAHVHQPAARPSARRGRPPGGHSIDKALASQDAILTSLLDISRMESGQLEVHVRDFALNALLEVVHNNFGMQAESEA
jgi:signal transduction histidine kinase